MAEAKAVLKFVRIAPRKARSVIDLIRGKRAGDALSVLKFTSRGAARVVEKVLRSAIANAENRDIGDVDDLVVSHAVVDQGPTLKRIQPAPQGRAHAIHKRMSHITVVVTPKPRPARRAAATGTAKGAEHRGA
ncbi:MAG: 50S ribosomal protein L22 [Nitrospirota bacterium]